MARTSYMLQQGHYDADLVYFYREDSNLAAIFEHKSPDVPPEYGLDYINADALIHDLRVADGKITTPGGTTYRLLGLDPYSRHMSLPVLQAIHNLVMNGATVAGPMATDDPSLADDQAEFHRVRTELFGNGSGVHHIGKGTVYAGQTPAEAFKTMKCRMNVVACAVLDASTIQNDVLTHHNVVMDADGQLYNRKLIK